MMETPEAARFLAFSFLDGRIPIDKNSEARQLAGLRVVLQIYRSWCVETAVGVWLLA